MSPSLEDLPAELLEEIAEHLSDSNGRSLGNLRLTCRKIHAKTMLQFGSIHFNIVTVYVHPKGFSKLLKVCQHHQFRSQVRELELNTEPLATVGYLDSLPQPVDSDDDPDLLPEPIDSDDDSDSLPEFVDSDDDSISSADSSSEEVGPHKPLLDPTVLEFIHNGNLAHYLRYTIGLLVNLEHLLIEQAYVRDRVSRWPDWKYRYAWSATIRTTLSIIRAHGIRLKGFHIDNISKNRHHADISVIKPISKDSELLDVMTSLGLEFNVEMDKPSNSSVPALTRVLKSAKALTSIYLLFGARARSGEVLSEISRHVGTFPKLKSLILSHMSLPYKVLVEFISTCKGTLQSLSLNTIFLDLRSWRDFFVFLLNELSLRRLSLFDVYEHLRHLSFRAIHLERPIIDNFYYHDLSRRPQGGELDFLQTFQYVTRQHHKRSLDLSDGDGEDIREWISMLADNYEF